MFPSRINFTVFAGAFAVSAFACGPDFPATIIDREDALLAAPYARYADSLKIISLPPAEFHAVSRVVRKYPAPDETSADQALTAELADLTAAGVPATIIAAHRSRRLALAQLPSPDPGGTLPAELARTDGLPPEFADYHEGAFAFVQNDFVRAARAWQRLLARPAAQRKFKSTWAAFMLGRIANDGLATHAGEARAHFQAVRQLAREGFADSLGLAAASLGWEAKTYLDAGDFAHAAELYLAQFASGDATAANSLRFTATRVLAAHDDTVLTAFARDSRLREIVTALFLSQREGEMFPQFENGIPNVHAGATARWLAALGSAGVTDAPRAAPLALAAYRAGDNSACEHWLKLAAPDDALATWLHAKLALRAGRIDEATGLLAHLVRHDATALNALGVDEDDNYPPRAAAGRLRGELGALRLARRDYTEALNLLLEGGYWEDAAYIAERVLTVDELKTFLDTHSVPPAQRSTRENDFNVRAVGDLRHLLARRLVRHDRLQEARGYFPGNLTPVFDRFVTLLNAGRDTAQSTTVRSSALMDAARTLRSNGLELRGTELAPDFAVHDGEFPDGLGLASRESLPPSLGPSADEINRARTVEAVPEKRFHYRYAAADLAWEAIALMPDESPDTARALVEAGAWLKARDPQTANRFYQALVRRCRDTTLGRQAAAQHWFPK